MKRIIISIIITLPFLQINAQSWQNISCGYNHSIAVRTDGTLWAWGDNDYGQLGNTSKIKQNVPLKIGTERNWKVVSAGNRWSIALKNDGTIWYWGSDQGFLFIGNKSKIPARIGIAKDWKKIQAGEAHFMAMKTNGTLWAFGYNLKGQLGTGNFVNKTLPIPVMGNSTWMDFSIYGNNSLAIKADGTLWAWGDNFQGQLGDGTKNPSNIPLQVGLSNNWKHVVCARDFMIAIKNDGTLWGWGNNYYGQSTPSRLIVNLAPTQIGTAKDWQSISVSDLAILAIKTNGTLWGGTNAPSSIKRYSMLGEGIIEQSKTSFHQIGIDNDWLFPSTYYHTSALLKKNGTLWIWGENLQGQVGDGTNINSLVSQKIN